MSLLISLNTINIVGMKHPWIAAIIIATILILFRMVTASQPELANFSPIAALLFCGAVFWRSNKWMLPTALLIWIISNPIVNFIQGYPLHSATFVTVLGFLSVLVIGFCFARKSKSTGNLVLGTILGATAFYIITNSYAFIVDPLYAKNLSGYVQCMWTGTGGIPTWVFFRNSLIANSLGTVLFITTMSYPAIKHITQFKLARQQAS